MRVIIFDFDGVLVDSNAIKRDAYFEIFSDIDPDGNRVQDVLRCWKGEGNRYQVIERILRLIGEIGRGPCEGSFPELVADYAARYNDICETHQATCPEVPGTTACLKALFSRYLLYVNSATLEEPLRRVVRRRGWKNYFRDVLGSPRSKSENLKALLNRERIDGSQAVVVGDGQIDLVAAKLSSCRFIGVQNPFNDFDRVGLAMIPNLCHLDALLMSLK